MNRKKILILAITVCALCGALTFANFHSIEKFFKRFTKDEDGDSGAVGTMLMLWQSRAYPDPTNMEQKYLNAWEYAKEMKLEAENVHQVYGVNGSNGIQSYNGNWSSLGFNSSTGGRILSIAINPTRGNSIYIGSASGGIWKTYNAQAATPTWQSVTTGFPVLGVSSIIINPSDTNIIYAGTGEIYRIDSTLTTPNPTITGYNVWKTRGTYGVGILKSSDGGTTWSQAMVKSENSLFGIQKLRFDPTNPNTIYAAATDGLYRSTNSGGTWTRILVKNYVSDVVVDAKNNNEIVVGVGNLLDVDKGVYRSADGGSTWTKIGSALPAATAFQGSIHFDNVTSVGNRDTIWASIGVDETGSAKELYLSNDFGLTWAAQSNSTHASYQFWYAHVVAINPGTTSKLIFGGVNLYSGTTGSPFTSSGITGSVHPDIHDIKFDPSNNNYVYVACDGGMYRSSTAGSSGSFSAINNGLVAIQFFSTIGVSSSASSASVVVGGLQDNNVWKYTSAGVWTNIGGSDGGACFFDPTNNSNVVTSNDARQVYYSTSGGSTSGASQVLAYWGEVHDSRTAFIAPLAISKSSPSTIYVGTDELFKTTNVGGTWTGGTTNGANPGTNYIDGIHKTAIALAISPTTANKVYVSTSPFAQYDGDVDSVYYNPSSNVQRTTNGATPFTKINGSGATALPNRYIMHFAISPTHDDSVWVAIGGFGSGHVYVTGDGGATWTNKDPGPSSGGLPDVPANAIMLDPNNSKIIYVGTDMGAYVSPDNGTTWQDFNGGGFWDGMLIMDLEPYPGNKILAATHGKGAFISPLYSVSLPVTLTSFTGYNNNNGYDFLQWSTSIESGIKEYDLERSADGRNYSQLTSVPAKNIDNSNYSYNDNIAGLQNASTLFYRLKIVNLDGTTVYSNIVTISLNPQPGIAIAGNPFNDQFTVIFTTLASQPAEARLLDANGRVLIRRNYTLQAGTNNIVVQNLGSLAKGVYLLDFITPNQRFTRKVVKK